MYRELLSNQHYQNIWSDGSILGERLAVLQRQINDPKTEPSLRERLVWERYGILSVKTTVETGAIQERQVPSPEAPGIGPVNYSGPSPFPKRVG